MLHLLILLSIALTSLPTSADTPVFKSRDADGNPVYSDQASDDAEEITLDKVQTFEAQKTDNLFRRDDKIEKTKTGPAYQSLTILSPENDTALRRNAGDVTITLSVDPALQPNHTLQLLVDGQVRAENKSAAPINLTNLDRGTHQFQAQIIEDESGEVLQTSNTVSATILRVSVINRAN